MLRKLHVFTIFWRRLPLFSKTQLNFESLFWWLSNLVNVFSIIGCWSEWNGNDTHGPKEKNKKTWQTAPLHKGQFPNCVVFTKDDNKKIKRNDHNKWIQLWGTLTGLVALVHLGKKGYRANYWTSNYSISQHKIFRGQRNALFQTEQQYVDM